MRPDGMDGEVDELYQDILLEHYRNPRNPKLLQDPDLKSEGFNPFCGDRVVLTAELDDSGRIISIGFTGQGCAISQASASMMTEVIKGGTLEEARAIIGQFRSMMQGKKLSAEEKNALEELAILEGVRKFPIRIKCALLAWSTLLDAIAEYDNHQSS